MEHGRDTIESSEYNEVSDSAYYNSSSNSRSRSSRSSKSTASKSLSSKSSGYGGARTTTGGSSQVHRLKNKGHLPEKRITDKKNTTETINIDKVANPETTEQTEEEKVVVKGEIDAARLPSQASSKNESEITEALIPECTTNNTDDSFSCEISIHDGVVMNTTASLTKSLGFPIEMWVGRSFIDFVHPYDQDTLTSQITGVLEGPKKADRDIQDTEIPTVATNAYSDATMICRVRKYRCLSTGFTIKDRSVRYVPFVLDLSKKNVSDEKETDNYVVIQAKQVFSAYKENSELMTKAEPFTMRHNASGLIQSIDDASVPYLGYIPQDIINSDVLQLYHCDDLSYINQVYERIVQEGGMPRSKTYRLLTHNGEYMKVETEWSSFINPCSKKLEFVTGKHYVIQGPENPDVFQSPPVPKKWFESEQDGEARSLRGRIIRTLTEVLKKPAEQQNILLDGQLKTMGDQINVDEDEIWKHEHSVMLGGVSPHYDYSDSKSSSDTQSTSYTYLNYNENLNRYFSSQAPFAEDMFDIGDGLIVGSERKKNCMSPVVTYSGDSSDSNIMLPLPVPFGVTPSVQLTEMLLTNHNKSMQKEMIKDHSEKRVANRRKKKCGSSRQNCKDYKARFNATYQRIAYDKSKFDVIDDQDQSRGVKRESSVSPPAKYSHAKHQCVMPSEWSHIYTTATATTATSTFTRSVGNKVISLQFPNEAEKTKLQIQLHSAGFQTATSCVLVQCVMLGQNFGPPMMNPLGIQSPEHVQRPADIGSEGFKTIFQSTIHFELDDRNYKEACKYGLPINMYSNNEIRLQTEHIPMFPEILMSTNKLRSTNALNRSNEEVPEWKLLRGVHQMSSDDNRTSEDTTERTDGETSYSSFYSTFLRTDSGSITDCSDKFYFNHLEQLEQNRKVKLENTFIKRKLIAPWTENVNMTQELIYNYEVTPKSLEETLENDKKLLKRVEQPVLVNEQLEQLYFELQLEGAAGRLKLEDGFSSSSSGEEGYPTTSTKICKKRDHSKYEIVYEENAPLPPSPNDDATTLLVPVASPTLTAVSDP